MKKTFIKDIPAFQFHHLQKFSDVVNHAVFTRHGGTSSGPFSSLNVRFGIGDQEERVIKNRQLIAEKMGLENLISANQTHSKNVAVIDGNNVGVYMNDAGDSLDDIDALITDVHDVALMVQVADCQAILMLDPYRKVIAAIHAGWKGLMQDISGQTINLMNKNFGVDPADLLVGISPSLGPCCAFFSNPKEELNNDFHAFIDHQCRVDLWRFSLEQLKKHCIRAENIEMARICTHCENGRLQPSGEKIKSDFFSYRADKGITGRFAAVIALNNYDCSICS